MIEHFCCFVPPSRYEEICNWYLAALAPIDYVKQYEIPGVTIGLGPSPKDILFWVASREENHTTGFHLCFKAKDHGAVEKFHEEGLKAGGKDNGKPGLRPEYTPDYYAAFVLDPLG